jgi:hypothetical protein
MSKGREPQETSADTLGLSITEEAKRPTGWSQQRRVTLLASLSGLPLLAWWLGWFPGFVSFDVIAQLEQAASNSYFNQHPAIHTLLLDVSWNLLGSPGYLGLVQVGVLTLLLVVIARRLVRIGVSFWLAVGAVWFVAALPAVGATTVALWKDIPFSLGFLWVFAELLLLAHEGTAAWARRWTPLRMGLALAVMWLFRHNGFLTVVPVLVVLGFVVRRRLIPAVAMLAVCLLAVSGLLYRILGVNTEAIEPAGVFIADVAAVVINQPEVFDELDLAYIERIAPLEVWRAAYQCDNSTPLVTHPQFHEEIVTGDPAGFRRVIWKAVTRAPTVIAGHRICVGSFLFVPGTREGGFLHRPPYDVHPNNLGIARDPLSGRAFRLTEAIYVWAEADSRLWFTWSPALPIVAALSGYGVVILRRAWRRWALPGLVLVVHTLNVVATSPAHEVRYAFPLYLVAWMSLPLLVFVFSGRLDDRD